MTAAPTHKRPKVPNGFTPAAAKLWRDTTAAFDLRTDELQVLAEAGREVMLIERLEQSMIGEPLTVLGSQGQPVMHPAISEVRQHRVVLARLLASFKLDAAASPPMTRSESARNAVNARWAGSGSKAS